MKNQVIIFIAVLFFLSGNKTFSQTALKMGTAGGPAGSGPLITSQAITLTDAVTSTLYSPAVTATYSLSNEQYGPGTLEGLPTNSSMNFGGGINTVNTPMGSRVIYNLMNSVGSATNAMFTPCNACVPATGMNVATDRAVAFFIGSDGFINTTGANLQPLNARVYVGDLTITFNRPVSNPVFHFVGMGGSQSIANGPKFYDLGFATEFDLIGTAVTLSKLSGSTFLNVSGSQITNSATYLGASSVGAAQNGITRYGASGSVVALGTNITSVSFRAYLRGDGGVVVNSTGVPQTPDPGWTPVWSTSPTGSPISGNSVGGDLMLFGTSSQRPVNISGTVFNDPNGGNVNNSSSSAPTNLIPTGLFANLTDANGKVIASVPVNTNGTYSFPAIFDGPYTVNISTTSGPQGTDVPPVTLPAGWASTGEFIGTPNTGNDGTSNGTSTTFIIAATDFLNINFGIDRLPESAINLQPPTANPGGFVNQIVLAAAFQTNNVGATPNTGDYDGGTISQIRISTFPTNANTITINGTVYINGGTCPPATTCIPWPGGGITIPYTNGVGPGQVISVDPDINGIVNVVIPFIAIDNAGKEDPTPGSVTLQFTSTLPVKLVSFTAQPQHNNAELIWIVDDEIDVAGYQIESSVNGINYVAIGTVAATGNHTYNFIHTTPKNGFNYYRLKMIDNDGMYTYSEIRAVNFGKPATITVFPNPAENELNIVLPESWQGKAVRLELVNQAGQVVSTTLQSQARQVERINVSTFATGIYHLRMQNSNGDMQTRKVKVK